MVYFSYKDNCYNSKSRMSHPHRQYKLFISGLSHVNLLCLSMDSFRVGKCPSISLVSTSYCALTYTFGMYVTSFSSISYCSNLRLISNMLFEHTHLFYILDIHVFTKFDQLIRDMYLVYTSLHSSARGSDSFSLC